MSAIRATVLRRAWLEEMRPAATLEQSDVCESVEIVHGALVIRGADAQRTTIIAAGEWITCRTEPA